MRSTDSRSCGPQSQRWLPNTSPVNDNANVTEYILKKAAEASLARVYPIGAVSRGQKGEQLADIAELKANETQRRMDCLDCHNRVGHETPTVAGAIDRAIDDGAIPASLPSVKAQAVARIGATYPDVETAAAAIDGLKDFYAAKYPLVAASAADGIDRAVTRLRSIYTLISTPHMEVTAGTYPNDLGHQSSLGCFRCHDDTHKAKDGRVISQECDRCHGMQ